MGATEYIFVSSAEEHPLISPNIKTKLKTLEDWLTKICQENHPNNVVSEFEINISFSQPSNEYCAYLFGTYASFDKESHTNNKYITLKPSNMYFKFNKKKFKNVSLKEVQEKLITQIKSFVKTEQFLNSFLSKADIRIGFSGEIIWANKQPLTGAGL